MYGSRRTKIMVGVGAGLAVAGGGAAIGASQLGDPKAESDAIVSDAAAQLGIQPSRLSAALQKALENRVDAAVAAGRLTKEQGDELKQRIASGEVPLFGGPHGGPHHGPFGGLDAAASYLGLTEDALHTQLLSGKSLADVARDQGKSVEGLVDVLVDAAKQRLDDAVADGRLTKEREQSILSDLKTRITDFVNGKRDLSLPGPEGLRGPGFWHGSGFGFRAPAPLEWGA